jgi:hypothetical protein
VGKRSHERPLKDLSAVSGTGTGHEGYDLARYMIMMPIKLREYIINVAHLHSFTSGFDKDDGDYHYHYYCYYYYYY